MSADYTILIVVAGLAVGGGLFLLSQAKQYRSRHIGESKHLPHQPVH